MRRILIVGGGYAGFYTAWKLEKSFDGAKLRLRSSILGLT
jgi:protoporphyrinogen oxidase